MRLWATRNKGSQWCEIWLVKPYRYGHGTKTSTYQWGGNYCFEEGLEIPGKQFLEEFGRLPRCDRPMPVRLCR